MLKIGQKVVIKGGFGSEPPTAVKVDSIGMKNGLVIIDYTEWNGVKRWAYENQIIDFDPDGVSSRAITKLKMQLAWFNDFVDYVQNTNHDVYNFGCEYADHKEYKRLWKEDE